MVTFLRQCCATKSMFLQRVVHPRIMAEFAGLGINCAVATHPAAFTVSLTDSVVNMANLVDHARSRRFLLLKTWSNSVTGAELAFLAEVKSRLGDEVLQGGVTMYSSNLDVVHVLDDFWAFDGAALFGVNKFQEAWDGGTVTMRVAPPQWLRGGRWEKSPQGWLCPLLEYSGLLGTSRLSSGTVEGNLHLSDVGGVWQYLSSFSQKKAWVAELVLTQITMTTTNTKF